MASPVRVGRRRSKSKKRRLPRGGAGEPMLGFDMVDLMEDTLRLPGDTSGDYGSGKPRRKKSRRRKKVAPPPPPKADYSHIGAKVSTTGGRFRRVDRGVDLPDDFLGSDSSDGHLSVESGEPSFNLKMPPPEVKKPKKKPKFKLSGVRGRSQSLVWLRKRPDPNQRRTQSAGRLPPGMAGADDRRQMRLIRERMAIQIQRLYRGWRVRVHMAMMIQAAIVIQRAYRIRFGIRSKGAKTIQKAWRDMKLWRSLMLIKRMGLNWSYKRHQSTRKIQCRARVWMSNRRVFERRGGLMVYFHAAGVIATGLSCMQTLLRDFLTVTAARKLGATYLQTAWRGYATRKRERGRMALRIQRLVRQYVATAIVKRLRREREAWEKERWRREQMYVFAEAEANRLETLASLSRAETQKDVKALRRRFMGDANMVLNGDMVGAVGGLWALLLDDAPGGVGYSGAGAGAEELDAPRASAAELYRYGMLALPPPPVVEPTVWAEALASSEAVPLPSSDRVAAAAGVKALQDQASARIREIAEAEAEAATYRTLAVEDGEPPVLDASEEEAKGGEGGDAEEAAVARHAQGETKAPEGSHGAMVEHKPDVGTLTQQQLAALSPDGVHPLADPRTVGLVPPVVQYKYNPEAVAASELDSSGRSSLDSSLLFMEETTPRQDEFVELRAAQVEDDAVPPPPPPTVGKLDVIVAPHPRIPPDPNKLAQFTSDGVRVRNPRQLVREGRGGQRAGYDVDIAREVPLLYGKVGRATVLPRGLALGTLERRASRTDRLLAAKEAVEADAKTSAVNPILRRMFNLFDVEQRGALDLEQLALMMTEVGVPVDAHRVIDLCEVEADMNARARRHARLRVQQEGRRLRRYTRAVKAQRRYIRRKELRWLRRVWRAATRDEARAWYATRPARVRKYTDKVRGLDAKCSRRLARWTAQAYEEACILALEWEKDVSFLPAAVFKRGVNRNPTRMLSDDEVTSSESGSDGDAVADMGPDFRSWDFGKERRGPPRHSTSVPAPPDGAMADEDGNLWLDGRHRVRRSRSVDQADATALPPSLEWHIRGSAASGADLGRRHSDSRMVQLGLASPVNTRLRPGDPAPVTHSLRSKAYSGQGGGATSWLGGGRRRGRPKRAASADGFRGGLPSTLEWHTASWSDPEGSRRHSDTRMAQLGLLSPVGGHALSPRGRTEGVARAMEPGVMSTRAYRGRGAVSWLGASGTRAAARTMQRTRSMDHTDAATLTHALEWHEVGSGGGGGGRRPSDARLVRMGLTSPVNVRLAPVEPRGRRPASAEPALPGGWVDYPTRAAMFDGKPRRQLRVSAAEQVSWGDAGPPPLGEPGDGYDVVPQDGRRQQRRLSAGNPSGGALPDTVRWHEAHVGGGGEGVGKGVSPRRVSDTRMVQLGVASPVSKKLYTGFRGRPQPVGVLPLSDLRSPIAAGSPSPSRLRARLPQRRPFSASVQRRPRFDSEEEGDGEEGDGEGEGVGEDGGGGAPAQEGEGSGEEDGPPPHVDSDMHDVDGADAGNVSEEESSGDEVSPVGESTSPSSASTEDDQWEGRRRDFRMYVTWRQFNHALKTLREQDRVETLFKKFLDQFDSMRMSGQRVATRLLGDMYDVMTQRALVFRERKRAVQAARAHFRRQNRPWVACDRCIATFAFPSQWARHQAEGCRPKHVRALVEGLMPRRRSGRHEALFEYAHQPSEAVVVMGPVTVDGKVQPVSNTG